MSYPAGMDRPPAPAPRRTRPDALAAWPDLAEVLRGQPLAVFLDYDGTLAAIAPRPELAVLSDAMRKTLATLAAAWPTYVVSGRGLDDVRAMVGLDGLWYAGSHGFDIAGPGGKERMQRAPELEPEVRAVAAELARRVADVPGALVEDKRFSLAVHYRQVDAAAQVAELERRVDAVLADHPDLVKAAGKKVFELRPSLPWDKGKALLWLLAATGQTEAFPVYVGDDVTDEDAFRVIAERGRGLTVLVADQARPTDAAYAVRDPAAVATLLERLTSLR